MVYSSSIYDENSVDDEGLSLFSVESPQRIDIPRPSSYGIIRPPEAMFSPEAVAALRQNKDADDYVPYVPPTRLPYVQSLSIIQVKLHYQECFLNY